MSIVTADTQGACPDVVVRYTWSESQLERTEDAGREGRITTLNERQTGSLDGKRRKLTESDNI